MDEHWKDLVLKWINCFFDDNQIKDVKDIKQSNFLGAFSSRSLHHTENSFESLLQQLRDLYPQYVISNADDNCWTDDTDLFLLAMLLLLHASVYHPFYPLQQRANKKLSQSSQLTIVNFLEKAMSFGQNITRENMKSCIPSISNTGPFVQSPATPKVTPNVPSRVTTPLEDFLSSPVTRRSRMFSDSRKYGKIANLEAELENSEREREELIEKYESKINELSKQLEEKCTTIKSLEEYLTSTEKNKESQSETETCIQSERVKLRDEVKELKQYVNKLERDLEELNDTEALLQRKILCAEKKAAEWEMRFVSINEDCASLQEQVKQQAFDNEALLAKCHELEALRNNSATPTRLSVSPNIKYSMSSPVSAPESLGHIIETKLIEKEKENEELQNDIAGLEKKLTALQTLHEDLQNEYFREKESFSRAKLKHESREKEHENIISKLTEEVKEYCGQKDKMVVALEDIQGKYETTTALLKDTMSARDTAVSEAHSVNEMKQALEVKVAYLNARLQIAEEAREEFQQNFINRSSEIVALKQELEALQAQVRSAVKDRDKMEQNLSDITKKRDILQCTVNNMDVAKEILEEKVSTLQKQWEDQKDLLESLIKSKKELQEQASALSKGNERLLLMLKNVNCEKESLTASCSVLANKNNIAVAQIVSLTDEKVRIEAQLEEALKRRDEASNSISKVLVEKKEIQEEMERMVAENERLSCQVSISTQHESDLNLELQEILKQKKSLEKQLTSAIQESQKHENALKNSASELSKVILEKENLTAKHSTEISKLNGEVQHLQHSINKLSGEKEHLDYELTSTRKAKSNLEQQLSEISQKFHSEVACLKAQLEGVLKQCKEKDAILNDLSAEKSDIEADLTDHLNRLRAAMQDSSSLKAQIEHLSKNCTALSDEKLHVEQQMEKMKLEYSAVLKEKDALVLTVNNMTDEGKSMQLKLHSLNEDNTQLVTQLNLFKETDSELRTALSTVTLELDKITKQRQSLEELFESKCEALQEQLDRKSEQLLVLQEDHSQLQLSLAALDKDKNQQDDVLKSLTNLKIDLENKLASSTSNLEMITFEKENICLELDKALKEKDRALSLIETLEVDKKIILSQLEAEKTSKEETNLLLKSKESMIVSLGEKVTELMKEKGELELEFGFVQKERENLSSKLELYEHTIDDLQCKMCATELQLEAKFRELSVKNDQLVAKDREIKEINAQLKCLREDFSAQNLELHSLKAEFKEKKENERNVSEDLCEARSSIKLQDDKLALLIKEKENLEGQLEKVQKNCQRPTGSLREDANLVLSAEIVPNYTEEILIEKDKEIFSLREELNSLRESKLNKFHEEMTDNHKKVLCPKENCQDVENLKRQLEEEKYKMSTLQSNMNSEKIVLEQKIANLSQQLAATRSQDKLAQLEKDEYFWQLDRAKGHLEFRLDGMMNQKQEVEEHLSQLRIILEDVRHVSDNLYSALPPNCDAVHEVTTMKKEVEKRLRAVDEKYADSLCRVIKSTYDIHKWIEKQAKGNCSGSAVFSEKDSLENNVSAVCDVMTSLVTDVRAAINSCKFLSERCESYLKAQTRESLLIKTTKKELINVEEADPSTAVTQQEHKEQEHNWFGGASTLVEGYALLQDSYSSLEKQLAELKVQQTGQQPMGDLNQVICKLQAKVNALMLRPSQEQVDEKLKGLHVTYTEKLEGMKLKMKQVVKEEVHKVEQEKAKSEREIVAKFNKQISEFEEHIQGLSSQLWELGEKLLQEEQDHRNTRSELAALKERQLQFLNLCKQRTKSLDRFEILLHGTENQAPVEVFVPPREVRNQVTRTSQQSQPRAHSVSSLPRETSNNDDVAFRQTTKMAPASMGLAFPEEDEDGEVFNNDYLTELKEGQCRPQADNRRLSELQYRNSLCPPHLKSSYPLETQFHDLKAYKEEELKGQDDKVLRPGKDRGTGKDELTPRAVLREHNESQSSYGSGMLKAVKTTPGRLRALFPSSKVANASNLPASRRDENSTPGTPSTKRLSFFRRKFGNSKENHSVSSGYSSFR